MDDREKFSLYFVDISCSSRVPSGVVLEAMVLKMNLFAFRTNKINRHHAMVCDLSVKIIR